MHEIVLPSHTNELGTTFGGTIMAWVDICGAITAKTHSHGSVVTASIDRLDFLEPAKIGNTVRLVGRVTYVGRTSMEVRVIIDALDHVTGKSFRTGVAYITFVAIDEHRQPRQVPQLILSTPNDVRRNEEAAERRRYRLQTRAEKAAKAKRAVEEL